MNQCDGCQLGLEIKHGLHVGGNSVFACTASRYKEKRPYAQPNAQRRSIYTDAATWEALLKLGKGNASAGIREAVRRTEEKQQ